MSSYGFYLRDKGAFPFSGEEERDGGKSASFFMKLTQNIVAGLLLSPHWSALRNQARVPGTSRPSVDIACNWFR